MIFPRTIDKNIRENLRNDLTIIVVGARQTGKSTLLRAFYARGKEEGNRQAFVNLENLEFVSLLDQSPENLFKIIPPLSAKDRTDVFIDEIQYLKNPTNFLKYLFDEYRGRLKLIVSGSSAFYIDQKFRDSLAGRKRILQLYSLSFPEFLQFKNREDILELLPSSLPTKEGFSSGQAIPKNLQAELMKLFSEYSRFGGFPAVVLADTVEEKKLVLEDLVNSNVKKDIFEAGLKSPEKYYQILRIFSHQAGSLVNRSELGRTLGLSTTAIENYLYTMEKAFQIALVMPFQKNIRKEISKRPKVFFLDLGIRNFLVGNFEDFDLRGDKGPFLENLVFRQLLRIVPLEKINFWRTKDGHEVDFIIDQKIALEVKSSPASFQEKKYRHFLEQHPEIPLQCVTYESGKGKSRKQILSAYHL